MPIKKLKKEINYLNKNFIGEAINFYKNEIFCSIEEEKGNYQNQCILSNYFENFNNLTYEDQSSTYDLEVSRKKSL